MSVETVTHMETASQFAAAMRTRDVKSAVALLSDDAVMETPMLGTIRGRLKIHGTLKMIVAMGGGNMVEPKEQQGQIFATASGPKGDMLILFTFDEAGRISLLDVSRR